MKNYEFERLEITFGETLSFLDTKGNTRYGTIESYNPMLPAFNFKPKEKTTSELIHLKDVERIFFKE